MRHHHLTWALAIVSAVLTWAPTKAEAQEDGLFADFTTSLGSFSCRLDYITAPKAVANFVGLASGERTWIEEPTGRTRTNRFYNGLIFHRVIKGFMCQGGSPNGLGTDGPGYAFPDEFSASVRHDGPGVLSMANSGTNSNGAQFFITVTNTPALNNVHTIFGRVISGQSVVNAMNSVPTDASDKPIVPVVIQSISIRRVGPEANAFNIETQNLPVVSQVPLRIARAPGNIMLTLSNSPMAWHYLLESPDLQSWTPTSLGLEFTPPPSQNLIRPLNLPAAFFSMTRIQYASSIFAPPRLQSRRLTLVFGGGVGTVTILFDANQSGTYAYSNGTPGVVTSYDWSQGPYRGFLWPINFSTLVPMTLKLDFSSDTTGRVSGTAYTSTPLTLSGTFTLEP